MIFCKGVFFSCTLYIDYGTICKYNKVSRIYVLGHFKVYSTLLWSIVYLSQLSQKSTDNVLSYTANKQTNK